MFTSLVQQNLSALYPLVFVLIGIVIITYSVPKFIQFLARFTSEQKWVQRYQKIRLSLTVLISLLACAEITYDITFPPTLFQEYPQPDETIAEFVFFRNCVASGFLIVSCIFALRIFSSTHWIYKVFVLTLGLNQILAIWDTVPFLSAYFVRFRSGIYGSLFDIPISLFVAFLIHLFLQYILLPFFNKTKTQIDNHIYAILRPPIIASIILIGLSSAFFGLPLSSFWSDAFLSLFISLAIFFWTHALFRLSALILGQLEANQDNFKIIQPRTLPIFSIVSRMLVTIVSVYCFLLAWDIDPSAWIASAGIIGIAIAYASQDTLGSLLSGVAILTDAPYKLNDFLVLDNGYQGKVTHIGFRSTRIITPEHVEIVIPNSIMSNTQIVNMSGGQKSPARIDIPAGVAYGSDIDEVRRILLEIASSLEYLVKDETEHLPQVHFLNMGASSLDFVLRVWIEEPENIPALQDQANSLIYKRFAQANIEIPYTKQDVYLYNMSKD